MNETVAARDSGVATSARRQRTAQLPGGPRGHRGDTAQAGKYLTFRLRDESYGIAEAEIEATPDFGASVDTAYILGMAKVKGAVKSLLDIDKVVSGETLDLLQAKAAHSLNGRNPTVER